MGRTYFKLVLVIYGIVLTVCSVIRIYLKLFYIDHTTGFYSGQDTLILVFNLLLLAGFVFFFLSNRLRKIDNDYPVFYQSVLCSFLSVLLGVCSLVYGIVGAPYAQLEQGFSPILAHLRTGVNLVLGVLAGISFLWLGTLGVKGNRRGHFGMVFTLFPSLWLIFLLVTRFNSYSTLTTISDHLLAVLFMIFAALFLIGHGRTLYGFMRKDGRNYTIPSGLSASICGILLVVPNYIYMLKNQTGIPVAMLGTWESIFTLALSLYALEFVVGVIRSIKNV